MAHPRALIVVAATAGAVFAVLAVAVALHGGPLPLDGMVRDWFDTLSSPDNRDLVKPVARLGAREVLIPLLLAGGAVLAVRRRTPGPLLMLVGSYLGMALVVGPAKTLLHRPEPRDVVGAIGRSFPSGHAAQAILVYGMLALILMAGPLAPRVRAAATVVPIVVSAAVGFAVLFRDAHWLSDMVGGYAIGLVWMAGPVAFARLRAPWLLGVASAGVERGGPSPGDPRAPARPTRQA